MIDAKQVTVRASWTYPAVTPGRLAALTEAQSMRSTAATAAYREDDSICLSVEIYEPFGIERVDAIETVIRRHVPEAVRGSVETTLGD